MGRHSDTVEDRRKDADHRVPRETERRVSDSRNPFGSNRDDYRQHEEDEFEDGLEAHGGGEFEDELEAVGCGEFEDGLEAHGGGEVETDGDGIDPEVLAAFEALNDDTLDTLTDEIQDQDIAIKEEFQDSHEVGNPFCRNSSPRQDARNSRQHMLSSQNYDAMQQSTGLRLRRRRPLVSENDESPQIQRRRRGSSDNNIVPRRQSNNTATGSRRREDTATGFYNRRKFFESIPSEKLLLDDVKLEWIDAENSIRMPADKAFGLNHFSEFRASLIMSLPTIDSSTIGELLNNIEKCRYSNPLKIQKYAIPLALDLYKEIDIPITYSSGGARATNGIDLIGIASTGCGKTLAYLFPAVVQLLSRPHWNAIVILPTRELAIQINDEFKTLSAGLNLASVVGTGGVEKNKQIRYLENEESPVRMVVGTPGRLRDLASPTCRPQKTRFTTASDDVGPFLQRPPLQLDKMGFLVLDETARMLEDGFEEDILFLTDQISTQRSTMLFSATWTKPVRCLVEQVMVQKKRVFLSVERNSLKNQSSVPSQSFGRRYDQNAKSGSLHANSLSSNGNTMNESVIHGNSMNESVINGNSMNGSVTNGNSMNGSVINGKSMNAMNGNLIRSGNRTDNEASINPDIQQTVYVFDDNNATWETTQELKKELLKEFLAGMLGFPIEPQLSQDGILGPPRPTDFPEGVKILIFASEKAFCDALCNDFWQMGIETVDRLHGGRSKSQRETALRGFSNGDTQLLVATDVVLSTGWDIADVVADVTHLILFDFDTIEEYVNRIGRLGKHGKAIIFFEFWKKAIDNAERLIRHLEMANQFIPPELRQIANEVNEGKRRGRKAHRDN